MKVNRIMTRFGCAAIAAALLILHLGLTALAAEIPEVPWDKWDADATSVRDMITAGDVPTGNLDQLKSQFEVQRTEALAVSSLAADEAKRLDAEVAALGPAPEEGQKEAPETAKIRSELTAKLDVVRATLVRADRAATRARDLVADLSELGQRRFLNDLTTISANPLNPDNWVAAWAYAGEVTSRIQSEVGLMLETPGMRERVSSRLPIALIAVVAALFIAFGVRVFALTALMRRAEKGARRRSRLMLGVGATAIRIAALLIAGALFLYGIGALDILGAVGKELLRGIGLALIYVIGAYATAAALFSPHTARLRMSSLTDLDARVAFSFMMVLGLFLGTDTILLNLATVVPLPEEASVVFSFLLTGIGSFALWCVARVIRPELVEGNAAEDVPLNTQVAGILRRAAITVAIVAPLLSIAGYEFAARFLFLASVQSLGLLAIAFLIFAVSREAVDIYLADTDAETEAGSSERLRLIPISLGFLLFCILVPLLALVWGASWTDLVVSYKAIASGFQVGDVAISPVDFFRLLLVFAFGYTLTRMAQRMLRHSVLPKAGMSRGAVDAVASGVGYLGIFLAAVASISAAGLDLSNLAIVAGALSVGIGFGLQNIVNNFISGIILLVERPIRVGDWIEVGGVSGYVQKVNVRSTEIQTFDRASYILPNSDLISGAVLNWTHSDTMGRVIVSVGVAYGTDPRLVERLLLEIVKDHPMIVTSPPPQALFLNFGADALEFELRVFLRDINWMLAVKSDLNFKIAERFAEEKIEIPFAQRDLHIRNPEALAAAFRRPPDNA